MLKRNFTFITLCECIFHCSSNWLMPFKLLILCDGIHSGFISINNRSNQQAHQCLSKIELSSSSSHTLIFKWTFNGQHVSISRANWRDLMRAAACVRYFPSIIINQAFVKRIKFIFKLNIFKLITTMSIKHFRYLTVEHTMVPFTFKLIKYSRILICWHEGSR